MQTGMPTRHGLVVSTYQDFEDALEGLKDIIKALKAGKLHVDEQDNCTYSIGE